MADAVATGPTRRWIKVLLVASLGLNLLVFGAVAATMYGARHGRGPFGGPHPSHAGGATLLTFVRTLPEARRAALWTSTEGERAALSQFRLELRKARDEMHRALLAEPFEKARFASAQSALIEAEGRGRAETQALFVEIASRMTAEERRAFVRWQAERQPGGKGGRRGHRDEQPRDEAPLPAPKDPPK